MATNSSCSASLQNFSVRELVSFLEDQNVPPNVLDNFEENCVNGEAFLTLEEEDLKELVPLIGERTLVRKILRSSKLVS